MGLYRWISTLLTCSLASAAVAGAAIGQQVVPGPWGDVADPQKLLKLESPKARITEFRRQQMRAISAHFRSIEAVVLYGAPYAGHVPHDAEALARLAARMETLFAIETPLTLGSHGAKPEIWLQHEKFARHIEGIKSATQALTAAAAAGSELAAPLNAVRHQCLACHQAYRVYAPTAR